jgi:hypothetical protein
MKRAKPPDELSQSPRSDQISPFQAIRVPATGKKNANFGVTIGLNSPLPKKRSNGCISYGPVSIFLKGFHHFSFRTQILRRQRRRWSQSQGGRLTDFSNRTQNRHNRIPFFHLPQFKVCISYSGLNKGKVLLSCCKKFWTGIFPACFNLTQILQGQAVENASPYFPAS